MAKVKCELGFTQLPKLNILESRKLTVDGAEVGVINPDHFTVPVQAAFDTVNSFSMTGNHTEEFQIGRQVQLDSGQSSVNCNVSPEDLTPDDIFTVNKYDYSIITAIQYDGVITDVTIADSILTSDLEEASVSINWVDSQAGLITTTDLINSTRGYPSDFVLETNGFASSGDGGGGQWVQNGVVAQTPGQTPAQLGDALLNDASGNQWEPVSLENHVKGFGVIGDGLADDTAAATAAYKSNGKVSSNGLSGIRITSQLQIESTSIECGDTPFIIDYTETGSGSAILPLGDITFDNITINLTAGNTFRRVISFGSGVSKGEFVFVDSVDQINNRASTLDGAVQVRGTSDISTIKTKNFDNGIVIYQHSGTNIDNIICESYVRGCLVEDSQHITSSNISTYTASPNATQDPGHNGLLIENSNDLTLASVSTSDAGEHGVRVGGGVNEDSSDISIGIITSKRSGQCAFKANTDVTAVLSRLTIGCINSVDCATGSATGTNEDVCRLENVRDVLIGSINGAINSKANCGNDGVYMTNAQRVTIGDSQFSNPLRSAIYIDDAKGQCRDLSIPYIHLNSCTNGTAVIINSPTQSIEHMKFGGYLRDIVADQEAVNITASSPTGGVPNAVIFNYDVDVSNFTSPGSVVQSDLISSTTTASRIYNEMTPRP